MSSRQEEKDRRRREREEAERAAASSSAKRKRLGIVLGAVLALAVAVVVGLAVASGGDESSPGGAANVPTQGQTNEAEAARAAGCRLQSHRVEGRGHTSEPVQYRTNPPTSGAHDPVASEEGIYPADGPPDLEQSVHALEHGRINIQYKPGTPKPTVDLLTALVDTFEVKGEAGYHALLFQNQTRMQPALAATAWGKSLTCPSVNDRVYDAIRTFWRANVDKGPEFIP